MGNFENKHNEKMNLLDMITGSNSITKRDQLDFSREEVKKVYNTIFKIVKDFDVKQEYGDVYAQLINSIGGKYLNCFPKILDETARLIINEIYLKIDNTNDICMSFEPITTASSSNRKHFVVAKEIAEKTIKIFYFQKDSCKSIISYIEDYLPQHYTKSSNINKVVWYFLVCIVSYNQNINGNECYS